MMSGVHSKHVGPLKNFGIMNSITKLQLVGISIEHNFLVLCMQTIRYDDSSISSSFIGSSAKRIGKMSSVV